MFKLALPVIMVTACGQAATSNINNSSFIARCSIYSSHCHLIGQIDILDRLQQFNTVFHRFLKGLAA